MLALRRQRTTEPIQFFCVKGKIGWKAILSCGAGYS